MSSMIQKNHLSHKNKNSFFDDDFDHEFFNPPLISFPYIYPYYPRDPFHSITNQISKAFDSEVFKSIDFSPKINLSEDENNYYIHDDLSRMTKDQVKMELYDDNHVLTILVKENLSLITQIIIITLIILRKIMKIKDLNKKILIKKRLKMKIILKNIQK